MARAEVTAVLASEDAVDRAVTAPPSGTLPLIESGIRVRLGFGRAARPLGQRTDFTLARD
jgi:hypothetical protein